MADTQIRGLGESPAPLTYTVPGAQEIILKSLFASFDGTAAASPWYPCVRVRAPGGGIVGEYITQATVAAGGSADVSFGPFLRGATAAAAAASGVPNVATMWRSFNVSGDTTQTVNAHSSVAITFPHQSLPSDGSISWNASTPYFMVWNVEAIALEMLFVHMDGGNYNRSAFGNANSRILQAQIPSPANMLAIASDPASGDDAWFVEIKPNAHVVNDTVSWGCYNGDAVAHHIDEAFIVVYFWPVTGYGGGIPGWPP